MNLQVLPCEPCWKKSSEKTLSLEQENAQRSAMGCALMRYVEATKPAEIRLFNDPYTRLFLTEQYLQDYSKLRRETHHRDLWLIWLGALREKQIDNLIIQAINENIRQLVLLGSGYDSRALRIKALRDKEILVFEIDYHFMIQKKKRKLMEQLTDKPSHLRFVGMDFHRDDFERLTQAGLNLGKKTLFVAQALSYYLSTPAMERIFDFIINEMNGQRRLIFDYVDSSTMTELGAGFNWLTHMAGQAFCIESNLLKEYLTEIGFLVVENESLRNCESRCTGKVSLPDIGWYIASCSVF